MTSLSIPGILAAALVASSMSWADEASWKRKADVGADAYVRGDFTTALARFQEALQIAESDGAEGRAAISMNHLAAVYQALGRFAEAESTHRKSLALKQKVFGPEHAEVAVSLVNLGAFYASQGRYAEGESFYRRGMAMMDRTAGPEDARFASTLNNLAGVFQAEGRFAEAEPLFRRALEIREKVRGKEHPEVGSSLNNLAGLYREQGRFAQAEPLYRRALAIAEKALGGESPIVAATLNNLATVYSSQGRLAEAQALHLRALAIREKALGPDHPDLANSHNNLGLHYMSQKRYGEAESSMRRALEISERAYGPEHPRVAATVGNLAELHRRQERMGEALEAARRATAIYARRHEGASRDERGALAEQRRHASAFEQHVSLLAAMPESTTHAGEAFRISQLARATHTAELVARMAARFAASDDALGAVARERQDLVARWQSLDSQLVRAASRPPAQRDTQAEQRFREEQEGIRRKLAALDGRLEREFPRYWELANPRPVALEEAQKLLGEDEAIVVVLASNAETFVWALRRDAAAFSRVAITRRELQSEVRKLRAQLDIGAADPAAILRAAFDVHAANAIYRKLFGPLETVIGEARQLLWIPDGALESLPPGVLVTRLPDKPIESPADHAGVAWLAKKRAITVLPSVSSLRALRAFARSSTAAEPFCGFGNPLLQGEAGETRAQASKALLSRGPVADAREVRSAFVPLPETADELRKIASTLKASPGALYLGADATERNVKTVDLRACRNLAFATHGLMAGEFKGMAEPALVLTPPEIGTEEDDGLLAASEIARLKLNADWVVLSACNTAAADGTPGGEGLSGLAKAFFHAGARTLLVSHWAVSSDAAVAITTRTFEETAKGTGKAQALQEAMLALMRRKDFAHPALWAPFVLVGEGQRAR